jgi:hypothetical protein
MLNAGIGQKDPAEPSGKKVPCLWNEIRHPLHQQVPVMWEQTHVWKKKAGQASWTAGQIYQRAAGGRTPETWSLYHVWERLWLCNDDLIWKK